MANAEPWGADARHGQDGSALSRCRYSIATLPHPARTAKLLDQSTQPLRVALNRAGSFPRVC